MNRAIDIAKWFVLTTNTEKKINQPSNSNYEIYEGITHLKLQKLLYFSQGVSLAEFDRPLFNDSIEAWSYGPVIKSVYEEFKKYGRNFIELTMSENEAKDILYKVSSGYMAKDILDFVYENYAGYTAWKLVEITHQKGSPWYVTWMKNKGEIGTIDNSIIKEYFKKEILDEKETD